MGWFEERRRGRTAAKSARADLKEKYLPRKESKKGEVIAVSAVCVVAALILGILYFMLSKNYHEWSNICLSVGTSVLAAMLFYIISKWVERDEVDLFLRVIEKQEERLGGEISKLDKSVQVAAHGFRLLANPTQGADRIGLNRIFIGDEDGECRAERRTMIVESSNLFVVANTLDCQWLTDECKEILRTRFRDHGKKTEIIMPDPQSPAALALLERHYGPLAKPADQKPRIQQFVKAQTDFVRYILPDEEPVSGESVNQDQHKVRIVRSGQPYLLIMDDKQAIVAPVAIRSNGPRSAYLYYNRNDVSGDGRYDAIKRDIAAMTSSGRILMPEDLIR
ncbi:hypothetical protein [Streptomyces violascens]|uniref:hypothetical protein n=1 Tax=Streptomyces violascens TaxID=67381 RepID=UPI0036622133